MTVATDASYTTRWHLTPRHEPVDSKVDRDELTITNRSGERALRLDGQLVGR